MSRAEPTNLHRKSGMWGTQGLVAGTMPSAAEAGLVFNQTRVRAKSPYPSTTAFCPDRKHSDAPPFAIPNNVFLHHSPNVGFLQ